MWLIDPEEGWRLAKVSIGIFCFMILLCCVGGIMWYMGGR